MPLMTFKEESCYGDVISSKKVFVAGSYAEELDHHASLMLEKRNLAKEHLKKIESKLQALVYERKLAIMDLEVSTNNVIKEIFKTKEEVSVFEHSWKTFGWSSPLVKAVVKIVRKILFDNSDSFSNIVLVNIEFQRNEFVQSTNYLAFTFCRNDFLPESSFTFWIPIPETVTWNWKNSFIDGLYKITHHKSSKNLWYADSAVLIKSFSLEEISNAVKAFVLDDRKALSELEQKMKAVDENLVSHQQMLATTIASMNDRCSYWFLQKVQNLV